MAETLLRVQGLPELKALFDRIATGAGKKPLRRGISAGGQVVKAGIRANVRVRDARTGRRGSKPSRAPGVLRDAVIMKFARELSGPDQAVMLVTVRQGHSGAKKKLAASRDAFYGKFVERGHRIVVRSRRVGTHRGRALNVASLRARRASARRRVDAHPFMGQGFAASAYRATEAMVRAMTAELNILISNSG